MRENDSWFDDKLQEMYKLSADEIETLLSELEKAGEEERVIGILPLRLKRLYALYLKKEKEMKALKKPDHFLATELDILNRFLEVSLAYYFDCEEKLVIRKEGKVVARSGRFQTSVKASRAM